VRIAIVGANLNNGSNAGLLNLNANWTSGDRDRNVGGRGAFKKNLEVTAASPLGEIHNRSHYVLVGDQQTPKARRATRRLKKCG
jgi:hypothetical protein